MAGNKRRNRISPMKTTIIFNQTGFGQTEAANPLSLYVNMDIQPAKGTYMSFGDVDNMPDWVTPYEWTVTDTTIYFIGDAASNDSAPEPIMEVHISRLI